MLKMYALKQNHYSSKGTVFKERIPHLKQLPTVKTDFGTTLKSETPLNELKNMKKANYLFLYKMHVLKQQEKIKIYTYIHITF